MVAVGAVIRHFDKILLVQRGHEPAARLWTLPGGMVQLGETVREALVREIREECGIEIVPERIIDVVDYIEKDEFGKIKVHYVIADFHAQYKGGETAPASDVLDAKWFSPSDLIKLDMPDITKTFFGKHFGLSFEKNGIQNEAVRKNSN